MRGIVQALKGGGITISTLLATMTMPGAVVACFVIVCALTIALLVLLNEKANKRLVRIMKARQPRAVQTKKKQR